MNDVRWCNGIREKKRKRAAGSGSVSTSVSPPVDKMFMTTVCMAACMILAFPLDVPGYVPALLTRYAYIVYELTT